MISLQLISEGQASIRSIHAFVDLSMHALVPKRPQNVTTTFRAYFPSAQDPYQTYEVVGSLHIALRLGTRLVETIHCILIGILDVISSSRVSTNVNAHLVLQRIETEQSRDCSTRSGKESSPRKSTEQHKGNDTNFCLQQISLNVLP